MVAHAYRHVPFYRQAMGRLGLEPDDVSCCADLCRLPLISVDDLQRDPEAFRSTYRRDDLQVPLVTSGSTGNPRTVWHDLGSIYANAADGSRVHYMTLEREIRDLQGLWQWQALQDAPFHVALLLRLAPWADEAAVSSRACELVSRAPGSLVKVEVRVVPEIAPVRGARQRHVINLLSPEA